MSKKNVCRPMFVFDYVNRTIVGSKTSIKKAGIPGSKEQAALLKLMRKEPGFAVVEKEIESNENKRTYDGLTFAFMAAYISIQPDAKQLTAEYESVKQIAENTSRSKYPFTKKWFLDKFSTKERPFNMDAARECIRNYDMSKAAPAA
jgi:hypothetical protein